MRELHKKILVFICLKVSEIIALSVGIIIFVYVLYWIDIFIGKLPVTGMITDIFTWIIIVTGIVAAVIALFICSVAMVMAIMKWIKWNWDKAGKIISNKK